MQAVWVKAVWFVVGGKDDHHAALEQRIEHAAKDHRVGDVRDMELVEAQQPRLRGDFVGDPQQRIVLAPECVEALVHLAHEGVEMHAALALERQRVEEAVHQHALAAADTSVEVEPARQLRAARTLKGKQFIEQSLQARGNHQLLLVWNHMAARKRRAEAGDDRLIGNPCVSLHQTQTPTAARGRPMW